MRPLRSFSVVAKLPPNLAPMWELAYNFLFSWNDQIADLFSQIDQRLWRESDGNPVAFLNSLPQMTLDILAQDRFFLARLNDLLASLRQYVAKDQPTINFPHKAEDKPVVAYFSAEYGLDLSLPVYSGGLGILAGDHLKSASDLNVPLVAVGLCYQQGYFRQYLTPDGWQQERYPTYDFEQLPISPVQDQAGHPVLIEVDLLGEKLRARIWKAQVGRVSLYLLDSNIGDNPPHLRGVTARLYGGDLEMRLRQEILLGVGGIRALWAMGLEPKVIHMNEGHSAFAGLERIRVFMSQHSLSFEAAMELVASSSVFTTHTPVPAGNDRFPPELMQRYFDPYARQIGLAWKVFMALGREDPRDDGEFFCMTVLALRLSRFSNGVSKLHGHVSRNMWKRVWPQYPVEDVPIGAITNGVHMPTWVAYDMALLYDRYLGPTWKEDPDCDRVFKLADTIPESELWRTHERLRERLIDYVRYRLREQLKRKGARAKELEAADSVLNPQALTICFARRFATYKRANLLLQDRERLLRILNDSEQPVQMVFAGKAHPHDNEGKKIIQQIVQLCRMPELRNKLVFIEDYDMILAKHLVQGGDVWLNNPRRPLEACGTSGMKAMANGMLNLSVLDGWWDEAYQPDNSVGFAIGKGEEYDDLAYQDFVESQTLYNVLETEVIPDFYDRAHDSLPRNWIKRMKKALVELGPVFNAHRMVEEYSWRTYAPAYENYKRLVRDNFQPAKDLAAWRMDLMTKWSQIRIRNVRAAAGDQIHVKQPLVVEAEIFLDGLRPEDIQAEIYAGPLTQDGQFAQRTTTIMRNEGLAQDGWHLYRGQTMPGEAGRFGFTMRILPHHPLLLDPHSLGLIRWVDAQ
ncbi:alpha-glucan family phosphorylase [Desulfocurvibacter africanus]|uniref:Alpha-glucan phosphorylase n=1 Tax=Desulfocurvibacter africanus subsp. africanus str. Walvis Bay TaxID=690850 RepID=F3YVC7_DESAF|nr:alpha-glucan family phosphorylase [Desulfocurvibacter africanus]EGJ48519.1 alpha-glucan phosphorylase [Desulfocurvibacter africanus subsp. africanus str. Walvis Bay]